MYIHRSDHLVHVNLTSQIFILASELMAFTSYNMTPSSSASNSPPTLWDVFLSFRGIDTRYTFTDHLYKALHRTGIRTFKDNPELRSGDVISDSLIQAIRESKTCIVVLSENYASSSWCLDELVEILDCYKRMKRLVIPVFYNIDPSVVRRQSGSFKEAFEKHQTRFKTEKVNKWRLTLNEVADFSGYNISKNRSQADIIDEVVDRISLEINPKTLYVAKYPVGLDSRVKDITALLNSDPEGVVRIGIHGMGGVGKTTLAKAVYNQICQRFQGSCFLANVREVSGTDNGLVGLQHQLIVDVLKCNNFNIGNKDQGIELIRARICSTKVLIVIDDLDNTKPLEYLEGSFALGSVIVITTRNEDLLDGIRVKAKYKVNEMNKDESSQLFAQHAFGEEKISVAFTELSKGILERAGGLPLALQVFGSTLLNKSEEGWRWFIDRLKQASNDDVEENLMISFDALKSVDPYLQNIFLDIACFYIGEKKNRVCRIMETCYTYVTRNIDILKKRCLITVDDGGQLGMHDLLRDMGRKIARNNCPDEPGKHSRLWVLKDIDTVLKNNKGTEAIKGIISDEFYYENKVIISAESFKKMSNLRFLQLNRIYFNGSFEQTFKDLRWLRWAYCPLKCLPSEFYPQKLVILELPNSKMQAMWQQNASNVGANHGSRVFENLKTLNMSGSKDLNTTPDFTRLPCLATLDLTYCRSLEEVHVSIGSLVSLVSLDLANCTNLRSLPDSICSLRALEVLNIEYCVRLEALPTELGNIKSLKKLNASELHVSKLPDSIGRLRNLVELRLPFNNNLETLPDSICNLRSLQLLDIRFCKKLIELPDQLGMITSLRELYVREATMLKKIPDISQLGIDDLCLSDCHRLLSVVELPFNLKRITAENCRSLKRLPDLSNLKQLENLNLRSCNVLTEIQGLEELTCLRELDLEYCGDLLSISELPPNLKSIRVKGCNVLTEIQGLEELTCLRELDLEYCGDLLSISELPPNLKSIRVKGCNFLKRLPNLSNLKLLKALNLEQCTGLIEIQGLEKLTSLQSLNLSICRSLKRLPNLSDLKQLEVLDIRYCSALTEIFGSNELSSLKELRLAGCGSSLLASTLTIRFFQMLSGFGQKIVIYVLPAEFPEWMSRSHTSNVRGSRMSFDLQPNASHNLMGIIFCFYTYTYSLNVAYSIKNIRGGFIRSDKINIRNCWESWIVIVPSSILSIGDGQNRLEVISDEETSYGIHLVYETEIKMISDHKSTIVNVEDERSKPSDNYLESNKR